MSHHSVAPGKTPRAQLLTAAVQGLNSRVFCRTLNPARLREQLESDPALLGLMQTIEQTRPHLFSSTVVFLAPDVLDTIAATIAAIERVIALPGYRAAALAQAPDSAKLEFGPRGVFMGYDFHIDREGPRLIEINTNAGGALLVAALARAQQACCEAMRWAFPARAPEEAIEDRFFAMFLDEWRLQRGDSTFASIAIVDDAPASQYLAPEFELARQMFGRRGVTAAIADAKDLEWRDGRLWHQGAPIDVVYNRLTDFYLEEPEHQALRRAYEAGAILLTPHPRGHALHADKRNLVALCDDAQLAAWGAAKADRELLVSVVPHTRLVTAANAEDLWAGRRKLFFKPATGYGAKAAYRGDKLTRRVWGEILAGDYVAQGIVTPGERLVEIDGTQSDLKFDVRAYSYAGEIQLFAARIYSGQTTNFRTPGGGFAPVVRVPDVNLQQAGIPRDAYLALERG